MMYVAEKNKAAEGPIKSYANYEQHARIAGIIREHSENKRDIRSTINSLIPWDRVENVLDLGCGYGWFEEVMPAGLLTIVGIDCLEENRAPFLDAAKKRAREAHFYTLQLPAQIGVPPGNFDLILSLYSLYFFAPVLPEVRRLLKPEGLFVSVTHSNSMLEEGQHYFDFKNLRRVIENFSAENGETKLARHFETVTYEDYPNSLVFRRGDEEKLAMYIDFKSGFIEKDADPALVRDTMLRELKRRGSLRLNKNDRVFLAKK